jgi:hypothetical protein
VSRRIVWRPGTAGEGRLVVTEDPAVSYGVDLELQAATAPFVCPDLPR